MAAAAIDEDTRFASEASVELPAPENARALRSTLEGSGGGGIRDDGTAAKPCVSRLTNVEVGAEKPCVTQGGRVNPMQQLLLLPPPPLPPLLLPLLLLPLLLLPLLPLLLLLLLLPLLLPPPLKPPLLLLW